MNTLVLCSMCVTLCITVAIQRRNTCFDFEVHTSVLAIQVRVVYFALHHGVLKINATCNTIQKPLFIHSSIHIYILFILIFGKLFIFKMKVTYW